MDERTEHREPELWALQRRLAATTEYTDLTHAFHPGQPHFTGFTDEERTVAFDMERGDPFTTHRYSLVGQWGTHVDPPSHFAERGRTLDRIPVAEMILPLVVLDISERVAADPDAVPTLQDVTAWERRNGRVPRGSLVALRTDWSSRWPDPEAMANRDADGVSHTPGWSAEVLRHLVETSGVTAVGHEQTDTDPGRATSAGDLDLERYVLGRDRWQIELLTNLHLVPECGALAVASWPKPLGGSGFPARVFALHPRPTA
ncbi:cyclase family protein [Streptomyces sp. P38-E01]|uniref:Cyclase family protein n=1 Tax=Streptomyces tardus TaxID=2780544 RepID=A0A949JMX1_9ACTN|nr:cyclase family protein [Streptomyces tardus]MBU7597055.1 cyclase family protein [Streptomyces tardus]